MLKAYEKYASYKKTNIAWLPEVPEGWVLSKVKYSMDIIPSGIKYFSDTKEYLSTKSIKEDKICEVEELITFDKKPSRANMQPCINSIWFAKMKSTNKSYVFYNKELVERYILSTGFCGLKNFHGYINFIKYYINTNLFLEEKDLNSYGTTQESINEDNIKNLVFIKPPIQEQQAIANFLDEKTSKIDALIQNLEKQVKLLDEKKEALINKVTTQGLNNNVKMKATGLKHLPQVPEHWEVKRLKYCVVIKNGQDYKYIEQETGYPVFGSGGVFAYCSEYMHKGKAILLGRKGTIDKPLYVDCAFWTVDTMFYGIPKINTVAKFTYYVATTIPFNYYITSTALPSITQNDLHNHIIAIPLLQEQQAIADYLDKKVEVIDKLKEKIKQKLELLKEYKKSLITHAVTGKIKVS